MEAKLLAGTLWKALVSGAYVNINDADVKAVVGAAAGLAKKAASLAIPAALVLATGLVASFALLETSTAAHSSKAISPPVGWGALTKVRCWYSQKIKYHKDKKNILRSFNGVCLNDYIQLVCDEHILDIPIQQIKEYEYSKVYPETSFFGKTIEVGHMNVTVDLFDNSRYFGRLTHPETFDFLTPLGKQTVKATDFVNDYSIESAVVTDVDKLRANISSFLETQQKDLAHYIGEENFFQFFKREA